jgi:UDP-glucose 4-epimerase
VYGAPSQVPIAEDDPKLPINPCGASKLMSERMLSDASAAHPFNYGALRYFNVAGADPQGRTGQMGKGATHLIKVAAEAAVGKRDHVAVYGTDYPTSDGTCIRDYIHVSDLAAAHVAALEWLTAHPGENLVMNCGYGKGLSVLEVLDAVDRHTNMPVKRVMEGRRAGDPPELVAANRRLLDTLEWRPAYADIDRIVADALAWERRLSEPSR